MSERLRDGAIVVIEERPPDWRAYAGVPIAFTVRSVLDPVPAPDATVGVELVERPLAEPYTKDYDGVASEGPLRWAERFDVSRWGVLVARAEGVRVGGAVVVADAADVDMLEGRDDLAALWDLRVHPAWRRHGVGAALFRAAGEWARERGCTELVVETQNVNVPACRFYAARGCELRRVEPGAYPGLPDEVRLLWYARLRPA